MWEKDAFSLGTYAKFESRNRFKGFRLIQLSEQLAYDVSKEWTLEFHYTYIHGHSIVRDSPWEWQHRLELEANRTFNLANKNLIKTRNRLEIRRLQDEPKTHYRLRQMTMLVIPIENAGSLQAFSMSNEIFYDITTHLFNQDRICPFQLTFALTEELEMDLFFLMRLFIGNDKWQRSAVLGTQFSF